MQRNMKMFYQLSLVVVIKQKKNIPLLLTIMSEISQYSKM